MFQATDSMANPDVIQDAATKREHLREWMDRRGLDGVILSRADNFAWITSGGNSRVIDDGDGGVGTIVITRDKQYLVSFYMDAERLLAEQCPGQGYELVTLYWYQGSEGQKALSLAGKRVGSDTGIPGTEPVNQEIIDLQWPLTDLELQRTRWLGKQQSDVLENLLGSVEPGTNEIEVEKQMLVDFINRSIKVDVAIVGSDERITKYRHVLATDKKIDRYLLLGPVISRWGLHSLCSRCVYFGEPPSEIRKAFLAAATIEGRIFSELREGLKFSAILAKQKAWYDELGYKDGWIYHFQGGPTGYAIVDCGQGLTENVMKAPQPYSWFTTVRGAKVEELSILTHEGVEIASLGDRWPTIQVETDAGPYQVPGMLIR